MVFKLKQEGKGFPCSILTKNIHIGETQIFIHFVHVHAYELP